MSKEAKVICREQPINVLRAIQRAGYLQRDPNPLTTTMIAMGTKYHILVDKRKLEGFAYNPENLCPVPDTRRYNKIPAKMEIIEDWLNAPMEPNPDNEKAIEQYYAQHCRDVKKYFNYDWANSRIQFGPTTLQRVRIQTR